MTGPLHPKHPLQNSSESETAGSEGDARRLFSADSETIGKKSKAAERVSPVAIEPHGVLQREPSWQAAMALEWDKPYWPALTAFVNSEYAAGPCFPPGHLIFNAFDSTPLPRVKVLILGQDPYHTPGAAMGLSFSVPNGSRAQPSLKNIFKELHSDVGCWRTATDLSDWAQQGVLLLNAVLTVRQGSPASHAGQGWETFTDAVIKTVSRECSGVVFVLWGAYAMAKRGLIDAQKHHILVSPHPSPFSAYKGFFGSRPFSKINTILREQGQAEIQWDRN